MSYRPYSAIKSTGIEFGYTNSSGITIPKGTPIKVKTDGDIDFINVAVEADVFALGGVTSTESLNGARAGVVTAGRIENITTSFAFGDPVYISKTGILTNTKPSIGVASFTGGDFIVRIGTIAKNETNPVLKDLILEMSLVGQISG